MKLSKAIIILAMLALVLAPATMACDEADKAASAAELAAKAEAGCEKSAAALIAMMKESGCEKSAALAAQTGQG